MQFRQLWYHVTSFPKWMLILIFYWSFPKCVATLYNIEGRKCWCNGLWTSTLVQGNVDCDMKYTREKSHKKAFSGTLNFLLNVLQKHLIFATLGRSMQSFIRKIKWPIISAICDFFAVNNSGTKTLWDPIYMFINVKSIEYTAVCW